LEQDDTTVGGEHLERLLEDLVQQLVELELHTHLARQLDRDTQPLIVAAQHLWIGDFALWQEAAAIRGVEPATDRRVRTVFLDRHPLASPRRPWRVQELEDRAAE